MNLRMSLIHHRLGLLTRQSIDRKFLSKIVRAKRGRPPNVPPTLGEVLLLKDSTHFAEVALTIDTISMESISDSIRVANMVQNNPSAFKLIFARTYIKSRRSLEWKTWFYPWFKSALFNKSLRFPLIFPLHHMNARRPDSEQQMKLTMKLFETKKYENFNLENSSSTIENPADRENYNEAAALSQMICCSNSYAIVQKYIDVLDLFLSEKIDRVSFQRRLMFVMDRNVKCLVPIKTFMGFQSSASLLNHVRLVEEQNQQTVARFSSALDRAFEAFDQYLLANPSASEMSPSKTKASRASRLARSGEDAVDASASSSSSGGSGSGSGGGETHHKSGDASHASTNALGEAVGAEADGVSVNLESTVQRRRGYKKFSSSHVHSVRFNCYRVRPEPDTEADDELETYKIMITNLPPSVDEVYLAGSLRNCGVVSKVAMFAAESDLMLAPDDAEAVKVRVEDDEEDLESLDFATDLEDYNGGFSFVNRNPLATFSSIKKLKAIKKRTVMQVLQPTVSDKYAFVWMSDARGFNNCIRDELRIFGVNIKGQGCKIRPSDGVKTLVMEVLNQASTKSIFERLRSMVSNSFDLQFNPADEDLKPVFILLKFETHRDAWQVYKTLLQWVHLHSTYFRLSWIQSSWYRAVQEKEKEVRQDQITIKDLIVDKEGEKKPKKVPTPKTKE